MSARANAITLTGYGLGIWWCFGGPNWAALASIAADELDGYVARKMNEATPEGKALDSTADAALAPLVLMRLGTATNTGLLPLLAAPPLLYANAVAQSSDAARPPLGSARAGLMLLTMLVEAVK